jgi:hypothetical protein
LAPSSANAEKSCVPSFFVHTAALEFQATLQLLAERARLLTGATGLAIAVKEKGEFIYSAVSGDSVKEAGASAILETGPLQSCVEQKKTIRSQVGANSFSVVARVVRNQEVVGFCEFIRGSQFADSDVDSIERISELIGTAIDHREAALMAENIGFDEVIDLPTHVPSAWHAQQNVELATNPQALPVAAPVIEIQKCSSCGFPVSTGRKLCVDCERDSDPDIPTVDLFTTPPHESWLGEHGYTIASVLVSALALAIILWFRSR